MYGGFAGCRTGGRALWKLDMAQAGWQVSLSAARTRAEGRRWARNWRRPRQSCLTAALQSRHAHLARRLPDLGGSPHGSRAWVSRFLGFWASGLLGCCCCHRTLLLLLRGPGYAASGHGVGRRFWHCARVGKRWLRAALGKGKGGEGRGHCWACAGCGPLLAAAPLSR
jgi:hypothetical protein